MECKFLINNHCFFISSGDSNYSLLLQLLDTLCYLDYLNVLVQVSDPIHVSLLFQQCQQ